MSALRRLLQQVAQRLRGGRTELTMVDEDETPWSDVEPVDVETFKAVAPFTMTSAERVFELCAAVRHVLTHGIPGAVVECGVWRGGSMMAVARTLLTANVSDRELYLFDTFSGMTDPSEQDVDHRGSSARQLLSRSTPDDLEDQVRAYAPVELVKANVRSTGYPDERLHFVVGPVEQTLPSRAPDTIAILRLDTDWHESTKHELEHLVPRMASGGILIVDDYGHWAGARRAVDEFLASYEFPVFLHRIDYTGRSAVIWRGRTSDGRR